ncbi:condensin-2 complex subunit D3-like isoform X2 [Orbicella faveolata]|uniref:condensin-2 complex subunit D3-like isoform X2 n=1 Tax=Orbicella faveolata TaxID=48498 RepID=UPI0009E5CCB8|nr:condensin-2 complex subunit D3-like isoform X2 [Orbicella faveolata]
MARSTTERTISVCNGLQISSIRKEWADQTWNSDFLESQGFPEVLENNIFDCGCFVRELQELLVISRLWTAAEGQGSLNEGLWKVLSENNFSHRVLISVLHSFIESCDKTSNAGPKLESCVLAANVYIVLVQIPGSGAYKVFHPLLFQKALDVLRLWPQKETNKRKRREEATSTGRKAKTRRGRSDDNDGMEIEDASDNDTDGSSDDEDDEVSGQINTEEAKAKVKVKLLALLQDVVMLLNGYSLKDSEQAVHHVIQLLVETTRLEAVPCEQITFDFPGSQIYSIKSIASLAYIGLGILCSPIHGDVGAVTRTVGLKHELIDTSVLKLGIHKSIFCHFLLQQVSTAKRRNKNCLVTATQDQDFLELPLQTIQSNLY